MNISELTNYHKVNNIILNILVRLFTISSITLLIGFLFFKKTELFQDNYAYFFIASLVILLLSLAVAIIRDNGKRKRNLKLTKKAILEINTSEKIEKIKKYSEIRFSGNYIITENEKIELDNKETYKILKKEVISEIKNVNRKVQSFELDPENFMEKIVSVISFGLSTGS